VVTRLAEVVEAMDPSRPSMAGIKAAQLLLERAHGIPVDERESTAFDAITETAKIRFQLSDADDESPELPPGQREDDDV
jgi:hypothetical protein